MIRKPFQNPNQKSARNLKILRLSITAYQLSIDWDTLTYCWLCDRLLSKAFDMQCSAIDRLSHHQFLLARSRPPVDHSGLGVDSHLLLSRDWACACLAHFWLLNLLESPPPCHVVFSNGCEALKISTFPWVEFTISFKVRLWHFENDFN